MVTRIIIQPAASPERIVVHPAPLQERIVINTGRQGEPGESGITGCTAGEVLGGHRCVSMQDDERVYHTTSGNIPTFAGIAVHAAIAGSFVKIRTSGKLTDPSFSFTPDLPVFCGADGILTQTEPVSGELLIVGQAVNTTTMLVNIQPIVVL